MNKKVDAILTLVVNAYKQCSSSFHEYFLNDFKNNIISIHFHNKFLLKFDERAFNRFVDSCMMYRLGLTNNEPTKKDIMYDLSSSANPEVYSVPLDSVLEKLIYSVIPAKLIHELKSRIDTSLDEAVVDLIISKLETAR